MFYARQMMRVDEEVAKQRTATKLTNVSHCEPIWEALEEWAGSDSLWVIKTNTRHFVPFGVSGFELEMLMLSFRLHRSPRNWGYYQASTR